MRGRSSGFNDAAIVWHAPAEGGIPRYMMIFQDRVPPSVGPVRSARQYYIAWAAEWKAVYAHVGGSPQALQTLRQQGRGQLVYNADQFRWGTALLPSHRATGSRRTTCTRAARSCGGWRRASGRRTRP